MEIDMSDDATALEDEGVDAEAAETEAPGEAEAEVEDGAETETESEADDQDAESESDDEESEQTEEEPEEIEFNFGGNKFALPKDQVPEELAGQIQEFVDGTWKDYTRKSQDVAERDKALKAREGAVEKLMSLNNETLDTYSKGLRIKSEIEELSQINTHELWQSDPDRARQVSDALSRKQAEFNQIVSEVNQKEQQLTQTQQQELERRKEEGAAVLEKQVKGFKTEKLPDVIEYAVNTLGMERESAERDWALNPAMTLAVHKAMQFDRMQAQAKKAKPKPAQAKPMSKPKKGSGGKNTFDLVKDADKMSTEEWAKRRNAQLAKKQAG